MRVNERWKLVNDKGLCSNCLRNNHGSDKCKITVNCKVCSKRHHTLLHLYSVNPSAPAIEQSTVSVANSSQVHSVKSKQGVLLATALIKVKANSGKIIHCRALLDNGSQNSLISRHCVNKLNLPVFTSNHQLVGINGISAETCLNATEFKIAPYFTENYKLIKALVVDRVTTPLPNFRLERQTWPHTTNLIMADPKFSVSQPIDILIGADYFGSLLTGAPIHGRANEPVAIPTVLGHILMGPTAIYSANSSQVVTCHSIDLKQFFETEAIPPDNRIKEHPVNSFYERTTQRTDSGRYIVRLPFIENFVLGDSASQALKAFYYLERKFDKNPELKTQYTDFMREYKTLNHMELITTSDLKNHCSYYLPHHAVINENSSTTKLRVVFNASAPSSNGLSLNSVLLKGPKLQTSIFFNLIQFRQYKIAITADIAKMYRQILIDDQDTNYQRIFWRENKSNPLLVYKLKTVTYGTACAPFLALKTIQKLCEDEKDRFPTASSMANTHMYVDDFLGGADSEDLARSLINELQNLFHAGGFELRKWASNQPGILKHLPESLKANNAAHEFNSNHSQRVLGLEWNYVDDSLHVLVTNQDIIETKRQLLSVIARIFDPLGLLSPTIIVLKLLLQEVWKEKLTWDDLLPSQILDKWRKFNAEVHVLKDLYIPRFLNLSTIARVEAHGFCDASPQAYAAVVYLKVLTDTITISLVAAKTRIAPLKIITLPKLELCGALLLAELIHSIKGILKFNLETFLWTDSTIVLSWIANPPKGNQFIKHRVSKIHNLTSINSWHHIPGKLNPADCATRGLYPQQLKDNFDWWHGPSWLQNDNHITMSLALPSVTNLNCENSIENFPTTQTPPEWGLLTRFSSYTRLVRIIAWIYRFLHNSSKSEKVSGTLSTIELNHANTIVIKLVQQSAFNLELNLLNQQKPLPKSSKLLSLNVFLDEDGLIRVGGRLSKHKTLPYETKHQILLPKHHHITSAIVREHHLRSLHAGPELVLSLIRTKYWIVNGRSTVKKEIRKCIQCARFAAQPTFQLMGDLPRSRISSCRPFTRTGIDFAGPIQTKCQHKRKSTTFKSYLCLFICMSTKAVHLELVSDLTTASFLLTLRRFISRRGYPREIFSDNGKTFVGAAAHLKQTLTLLKDDSIQDFAAQHHILWHFIPPYGPNFGGLWESSIKLAKTHLMKTCKGTLLTFEEVSTLFCLIEACINSRPLTPLSTSPNDFSALTPGHFLIGCALLDLPDSQPINDLSLSLSSRFRLLSRLRDFFWKQWHRQYLLSLQPRSKWTRIKNDIQVGQLVLVKQASTTPLQWNLARIIAVHPGQDQLTRVITVRTPDGVFKRPISQIAVLPENISDPATPPGAEVMERKKH